MEDMEDNEGLSTGKKVVAGAALGVAVPAAVAIGKKLLGDSGDEDGGDGRRSGSGGSQQRSRSRSSGSSASTKRSTGAKKSRSSTSKRSTSSSRSRSSSARGGNSSGRSNSSSRSGTGRTKEQLYNQAKRLKIDGRSSMTKAQLERAISRARS